jgi:SAM-dependent methyltransferase
VPSDLPLAALGRALLDARYRFITPTPETHRRVLARGGEARTLRDVFGWSKPFADGVLPDHLAALLDQSGARVREGRLSRSAVRFSSLSGGACGRSSANSGAAGRPENDGSELLLAHSAYPTLSADAVFFGPDTYRFAALLAARVDRAGHVADVGCGSGAGGLLLAPRAASVQLLDINPAALQLARVNAELNGLSARVARSDLLSGAEGPLDLVIANPPYLADEQRRTYRDGGGALGTQLSARIAAEALDRLEPGGRLLLYTATPVVLGEHLLWPQLEPLLRGSSFDYRELDPDVFGEELERPAYAGVERIAVVALDAVKR